MRVIHKDPEAQLIELLNVIDENREGWRAVCFAFSRLLEHYRSEYQIKIATNLMNDLLGDRDGAIFLCEDSTIYVVVRHFPKALMEKMIFQLRYLFMDDPLAYTAEGDENREFSAIYNIETQWQDFMDICKRRLIMRLRQSRGPVASKTKTVERGKVEDGADLRLFTAANLATIERDMRAIDIATTIRRQPVCAAMANAPVRTVFDEMYININHLRQSMGIEVDLLSNRWLFKYLTQILDERMLEMIQRAPARYLANPIGLNLNISTLLTTRFTEFDASLKPANRVSIVIELQIADVFADIGAFVTAREAVQKLGYRVCLDGVTEASFPHINRQHLGFDLIKMRWEGDDMYDLSSEKYQLLSDAIRQCGNNRVILSRCDTAKAVEFGQALGLSLFQGRYLDGLVNPKATITN